VLLQGLGMDVAQMQRALRRRVALFLVGAAVAFVATQIDTRALELPVFTPALVGTLGGLVALGGLLGLQRGAGCLAQILFVVLLGALTCGMGSRDPITLQVIAGAAVVLALLAFVLARRRRSETVDVGPLPPHVSKNDVIDVEAREIRED
jgi:MYXO-CTERM domain-containing protein